MAGTVFDTSVYINALRGGDLSVFSQTRIAAAESEKEPLYLSVVVLEELHSDYYTGFVLLGCMLILIRNYF
ncbi:MAG TPA: hypothetical protein VK308_08595 [Pyrinomonadaceae bacterium]|nr:hypothetical protein [Pyrinomonadaceae bacterium]